MESLVKNRERRANAGSRMGELLDKEDVDDFYKSKYGGFFEEENDNEYKSEASESDDVDSDFDIDETDEVVDFEDDEENKKRKSGRVITKAYREPKRKAKETVRKRTVPKRQKTSSKSYNEDDLDDEELDDEEEEASDKQTPFKLDVLKSPHKSPINQKKSLRTSTQLKSKATQKRTKLAQEAKKDRKRPTVQYRPLTQEEMLAEAKETEKLNQQSLERYEKLELEKSRKNKISRKQIKGPIIRYHSMTMPLIQELNQAPEPGKKCSRNFITFTEEDTYTELFKLNEPKKVPPTKRPATICPISKLPARYKDPVTGCNFSCPFTFRTLRETYYKQLEMLDENQKTEEIKKFLEWRKSNHSVLNTIIKSETPLLNSNMADC